MEVDKEQSHTPSVSWAVRAVVPLIVRLACEKWKAKSEKWKDQAGKVLFSLAEDRTGLSFKVQKKIFYVTWYS